MMVIAAAPFVCCCKTGAVFPTTKQQCGEDKEQGEITYYSATGATNSTSSSSTLRKNNISCY